MDYLGIAAIIIAVVGSVHFVHSRAYKSGLEAGVDKGRMQILQENLIREERKCSGEDAMIIEIEKYLTGKEIRIEKKRA